MSILLSKSSYDYTTMNNTELIRQLEKFSTATIHEAMGKRGDLPAAIKPLAKKMRICGPAYTVHTMPRDNMLLHRAYAYASPGNVIIASCSGFYEAGYWGDLMSLGAFTKRINGLVIDGCVRDADDIEAMGFNVFSRGISIRGTSNYGNGTLNEPIVIGSCIIYPGDIVVGDSDGVVVVPQDQLQETLRRAQEREEKEEQVRDLLRQGKTSLEIYGWKFDDI